MAGSIYHNWMAHVDVPEDCQKEVGEMDKCLHGSLGGFHGHNARVSTVRGGSAGGIGFNGSGYSRREDQ